MRPKHADRLPRLDEQRLVVLERAQFAHDGMERRPVSSSLAAAAVDDEILGSLGNFGIEVVVKHPQRGFLRPALAADLGAPRRADHGTCQGCGPITVSAARTSAPARTKSVTASISGASGRSSVSVGTLSRMAVVTARVASLASSGARRS